MAKQKLEGGPPVLKQCPACRTNLYSKYQVKTHFCGPMRSAH